MIYFMPRVGEVSHLTAQLLVPRLHEGWIKSRMEEMVKLVKEPKFKVGDRVNTGKPPHRKVGRIRRIFSPTPEGMWRYLVWHRATNGASTRPYIMAYDETELEGV